MLKRSYENESKGHLDNLNDNWLIQELCSLSYEEGTKEERNQDKMLDHLHNFPIVFSCHMTQCRIWIPKHLTFSGMNDEPLNANNKIDGYEN